MVKPGRYSVRPFRRSTCARSSLLPTATLRSVLVPGRKSRPGVQDAAVRSAPVRWRRHCRIPLTLHPPKTAPVRPHQRRSDVLLFEGQCLFAFTVVPRSTVRAALTPLGRPGPGRGGRLTTLRAGLFRCSREPEVSLPPRSRARRPHTARPPHRPRSTSFRALGHWETCRRLPASVSVRNPPPSPARPGPLQDSQQPRPTRGTRPSRSAYSTGVPRPDRRKRDKYIHQGGSGCRRCGSVGCL